MSRVQLVVERLLHQFDVRLVPLGVNVRVGSTLLQPTVFFGKIKELAVRAEVNVAGKTFEKTERVTVVFD